MYGILISGVMKFFSSQSEAITYGLAWGELNPDDDEQPQYFRPYICKGGAFILRQLTDEELLKFERGETIAA